jgi:hypothetical protein
MQRVARKGVKLDWSDTPTGLGPSIEDSKGVGLTCVWAHSLGPAFGCDDCGMLPPTIPFPTVSWAAAILLRPAAEMVLFGVPVRCLAHRSFCAKLILRRPTSKPQSLLTRASLARSTVNG